jgi:hypothetical protein
MPPAPRQSLTATIVMFLLFGLACFLYLVLLASTYDAHTSDAAGRGLAAAYAALFGGGLWIVLAIMLALGAARGAMPGWAAAAAVVLLPLSGLAAIEAAGLTDGSRGWSFWLVALAPPLIAFYALWAKLLVLHRALPPTPTSAVIWGTILLLTIVPLTRAAVNSLPNAERDAKIAEEYKAFQDKMEREQREANEREWAKFAALNSDSPLRGYVEYLAPGDSRFREAVAGARQVKSRQGDAAALLKDGRILALQEMWRLDLAATPELCGAYGAALRAEAFKINKTRSDYIGVAMDLERQMPNIKWPAGARCDLGPALTLLETNVRAVSDSPRMDQFADSVAALKPPP